MILIIGIDYFVNFTHHPIIEILRIIFYWTSLLHIEQNQQKYMTKLKGID